MPIPLPSGADGAVPAPGSVPAAPAPAAATAQHAQADAGTRPPLATALPAWDLLPPQQVLTFRRRA
jgi:hypothetical protein